ncbi:hypothetical protein L9F63_003280 [Diploptera punctata]|uniref:Uncharacterized protein n=1 Tax=Diploptera punctata TaxID=6984 RepID=A0AAD7ZLK5_DIPPU|nr:hypothetical protein L9F63_003280 [Diploptera punctata]
MDVVACACLFVNLFVLSLFLLALHPAENSLFEPSPESEVFAEPEVRDLGIIAYNSMASSICTVAPLLIAILLAVTWS